MPTLRLHQGGQALHEHVPDSSPENLLIRPGMVLDRYEVLCLLAQGGMASVWLARLEGKLGFTKVRALKTMLPSVADDPTTKEMFLDEVRIASRIVHPNVAEILDVGEFMSLPYFVMELIDGEPLNNISHACQKAHQ